MRQVLDDLIVNDAFTPDDPPPDRKAIFLVAGCVNGKSIITKRLCVRYLVWSLGDLQKRGG